MAAAALIQDAGAEGAWRVLRPGRVLVDHGPITMTVEAAQRGCPLTDAALAGAATAVRLLDELIPWLAVARRAVGGSNRRAEAACPEVLCCMMQAVRRLDEADFTPMAAVAGAFSELVARSVTNAGADRAIVNNGGDIALYLPPAAGPAQVGIVSDLGSGAITHKIEIPAGGSIAGIATSGLGGRSLTKGVASAVTILARTASLADAAATAVANATDCDDPAVARCLAEELDHFTDIRGHRVTKSVGPLSAPARRAALARGLTRAEQLLGQGMIAGAVLFVQHETAMLPVGLARPFPARIGGAGGGRDDG